MWLVVFSLLKVVFVFLCIVLIALILFQKGKSSLGIGALGGGSQLLFGGTGGQDLAQKATWVLGTILLIGSLLFSLFQPKSRHKGLPQQQTQVPVQQKAPPAQ